MKPPRRNRRTDPLPDHADRPRRWLLVRLDGGQALPAGYGLVGYDLTTATYLAMPVPLNVAARAARFAWRLLRRPIRSLDGMDAADYWRGRCDRLEAELRALRFDTAARAELLKRAHATILRQSAQLDQLEAEVQALADDREAQP